MEKVYVIIIMIIIFGLSWKMELLIMFLDIYIMSIT